MSYPTPTKRESRTAFAVDYFATREDAIQAAKLVSGVADDWYATPAGRAEWLDHEVNGVKYFAVTRA